MKGLFTLDSPVGGVSSNPAYTALAAVASAVFCDGIRWPVARAVVKELQTLMKGATLQNHLGASASVDGIIATNPRLNELVAEDAMQLGIVVMSVGNSNDMVWRPSLCTKGVVGDFSSTQWLQEEKSGKNSAGGAVYSRAFGVGHLQCDPNTILANHDQALVNTDVQKAIGQVLQGGAPTALQLAPGA